MRPDILTEVRVRALHRTNFNFGFGSAVAMVVWAVVAGTDGITVSFGNGPIKNPALWQVAAVVIPIALVIAVPFAVLMSERARRQFSGRTSTAAVDSAEVATRLSEVR